MSLFVLLKKEKVMLRWSVIVLGEINMQRLTGEAFDDSESQFLLTYPQPISPPLKSRLYLIADGYDLLNTRLVVMPTFAKPRTVSEQCLRSGFTLFGI